MNPGEDMLQPGITRSWAYPAQGFDNGLRTGVHCHWVCRHGSWVREYYIWLTLSPEAIYQPLIYTYSDPNNASQSCFDPAAGSTFVDFFERNRSELEKYFHADKVRDHFWKQYVAVGPKTFTELKRWNFGLMGPRISPEPTQTPIVAAIDLKPGMRLRVEHAALQNEGRGFPDDKGTIRGYVASGVTYLEVSEQPTRVAGVTNPFLSFDPFLGDLRESMALPHDQTNDFTNVASGTLDLSTSQTPVSKYRLVYPQTWFASQTAEDKPKNHVVLVGSDDRADLEGRSLYRMLNEGEIDWTIQEDPFLSEGFSRTLLTFRGRSFAVPEVAVKFDGEPTYVSVSTRFRQLVQRREDWPRGNYKTNAKLYRRDAQGLHRVVFHVAGPLDAACFEIPLLKGDEIRW
ncbi:hypothetical protein Pan97_06930 [Bremerella volcania]|uniref:Uncharacterized protein n=1 Tax=Bremerella volcania TaxID=2527984 RepID=A0A518C394_9BACT|nr:hypothetical protein [Bremerella volcania]QDU73695.1 hypothetical protein Pan97_06930 [Bremerella volcania]